MDKVSRRATRSHLIMLDIGLLIVSVLVVVIAPRLQEWLPSQIGRIWPVTTPAVLIAEPVEHGSLFTRLELRAEKLEDCAYRKVFCFLGQRSNHAVPVGLQGGACYFDGPPRVNGRGLLEWDNFIISVLPEQIPDTYVDVLHLCPIYDGGKPLIPVVTEWFTGSRAQ